MSLVALVLKFDGKVTTYSPIFPNPPHTIVQKDTNIVQTCIGTQGGQGRCVFLAAFNLQHLKYDEAEAKQYDTGAMAADYERFCQLEQEEIQRYKNKEKKDNRGTIGAEKL